MKPSVARRCKDQVREDGGREESCASLVCARAYVRFFFCVCVCGDGGQRERWNAVKQKQNSGSETGKKKRSTYPLKRGKM